jgi:hypothetical protein
MANMFPAAPACCTAFPKKTMIPIEASETCRNKIAPPRVPAQAAVTPPLVAYTGGKGQILATSLRTCDGEHVSCCTGLLHRVPAEDDDHDRSERELPKTVAPPRVPAQAVVTPPLVACFGGK